MAEMHSLIPFPDEQGVHCDIIKGEWGSLQNCLVVVLRTCSRRSWVLSMPSNPYLYIYIYIEFHAFISCFFSIDNNLRSRPLKFEGSCEIIDN